MQKRTVVLSTERLILREWGSGDGDLLDRHCNTEEVMKWLGGPLSPKKHTELIHWLISQQNDYGTTFWVLERKSDAEFLGFCGLVRVDDVDSTVLGAIEIGWRLRQDAQGHGFAKEAANACLRFAFSDEGMDGLRVVSRTVSGNVPSWSLMQRLGMRHDHRLDYIGRGEIEPFVVYVMTYEDWERVNGNSPPPVERFQKRRSA